MFLKCHGVAACTAGIIAVSGSAGAQANVVCEHPHKSLRWIVGFPVGGVSDVLARLVEQRLSDALGQQIVVDSRPSAGGIIASELAAKAPRRTVTP